MNWELEVLLHALVIVNLCGDRNGCRLPIVAIVTPRKLTRPAENEPKNGDPWRFIQRAKNNEEKTETEKDRRYLIYLKDKIQTFKHIWR